MTKIKTLRLILGDQLNAAHSWFTEKDDSVLYLIAELHQEMNYVKHHVQKIAAFFIAMNAFANALEKAGHQVSYLTLNQTSNYESLPRLLQDICNKHHIERFEYQHPDEFRLHRQLSNMKLKGVSSMSVDSEHFLLPFLEIDEYFEKDKRMRMETFYRKMRQRFNLLMDGDKPVAGKWNFDGENRKKLKKSDLEKIVQPLVFENDASEVLQRLNIHKVKHFGEIGKSIGWPTSRKQALSLLNFFCEKCLPNFGRFQDAMTANSENAWSLYHSRLSFALNAKIINPLQVVERAIKEYETRPDDISIAQIEGFVRQIIGWREFVRGIYWANMPDYANLNALNAKRDLPEYFWTGDTKMRCMQYSLGQSLQYAYAHHIQRLMVIGNFCLLAGIDPDQVDEWYLGVYIDAIEWVEMPNTRGMSQFGDNGIIASKPYNSSGAYINRMSDYCADCHYKVKEKVGDDACPFNSLYWHFMDRHKDKFGNNPRIGMVYRNLEKMDDDVHKKTMQRGDWLLENLNKL